jgi:hypothetical protein
MRDMIPPNGDRSIRNIPISPNHRHAPVTHQAPRDSEETYDEAPRHPRAVRTPRRYFLFWILGVIIVCGVAALLLSTFFQGATIIVYPRTESVDFPSSVSAAPNAPAGSLAYQTISAAYAASTTITASGTKKVSIAARGTITIYNGYSAAPQKLIANTRFAAPDGTIYRIHSAVVVPGMKGTAPGTVTATVYADAPGTAYNRGATTFTIPGFQGDPQYSTFYAKADSITGGLVGQVPAIAAADLAAAQSTLKTQLDAAVQASTIAAPAGSMLIANTAQVTYGAVNQTANSDGTATLSESATASSDAVSAADLASAIAKQKIGGYGGEAVAFVDPSKVSVSAESVASATLTLDITGSSPLVWQFDPQTLKAALLGKSKADFQTIIQSFEPAITRAEAHVRPFWDANFPANPDKIDIQVASS